MGGKRKKKTRTKSCPEKQSIVHPHTPDKSYCTKLITLFSSTKDADISFKKQIKTPWLAVHNPEQKINKIHG